MPAIVKEYFLPQDKSSQYIILAVAFFLIIGVWTVILAFVIKNPGDIIAYEKCPVGECPTNTATGEKRCPASKSVPLSYDPIFEVCNPPESCSDVKTPYAVQLDSSTNLSGTCGTNNDQCRCVNYLTTPSYIEVLFNMQGGSLYSTQLEAQSRVILSQQPNQYTGEGNNIPMTYSDPTTQLWEISPSLLSYLWPNPCGDVFTQDVVEITKSQTLYCINKNPCMVGRMAFIPANSTAYASFTDQDISGGVPLACVPNSVENSPTGDNSCISDEDFDYAPIFDPTSGRVYCKQTTIPRYSP
jgi:hypothetical protein